MATWLIAVAATYFLCVRPLQRGRGHCARTGNSAQDTESDRLVAALREELRTLRAQDALDSSRVPSSKPTPPRVHDFRLDAGDAMTTKVPDTIVMVTVGGALSRSSGSPARSAG